MAHRGSANRPTPAPEDVLFRIMLRHGPHRWTFVYRTGDEGPLVDRVAELARDPAAPLDWHDARTVCQHIARMSDHAPSTTDAPDAAASPRRRRRGGGSTTHR